MQVKNKLTKQSPRFFKLLLSFLVPMLILQLPPDLLFIDGITLIQQRVLAIFVLATLLWVLEPVPVFATSLLIITLELMMISNQGLSLFIGDLSAQNQQELLDYQQILNVFSSPIIILFLGGFSLAIAASKYDLDQNLARVLLKPFGYQVKYLILGCMLITAVFSMFMSNTATTVMMLSILAPVLRNLPAKDGITKAFILAIPVAANTGGMATPIGTPPNAIALSYLNNEHMVSFLDWMKFGVPYVFIQLFIGWVLLQKLFPTQLNQIELKLHGQFNTSVKAKIVYVTFAITILLWLTTAWHGMNSYVVAIIPITVFCLTSIIGKQELKEINWDVLFLVAGGIAIGHALETTGLAKLIAGLIQHIDLSATGILICFSLLCWLMANFMSNTATANLIMPLAVAMSISMPELGQSYSLTEVLIVMAFSASLGMILPISTPPNSLAYSTGFIQTKDMAKIGFLLGVTGLILLFLFTHIF